MIIFNLILYYLVIIPASLLPYRALYLLSDVLYFFIYHLIGYRKTDVYKNIKNSFPEKSEMERLRIQKIFYSHLCDLVVESLKAFTVSEKELKKHMVCNNPQLVNEYFNQNTNVILAGGHYNNWEMFAQALSGMVLHRGMVIYTPLTNKFFDQKMRITRGKFGLVMVPTTRVKYYIEQHKQNPLAIVFGFDQSPSNPRKAYWQKFLNQDTAVLYGTEKLAKEYNYPVLYGRINKVKRGHYTLDFFKVTDNPQELPEGALMKTLNQLLEKDIKENPQYWLWSHKRWKHKPPIDL